MQECHIGKAVNRSVVRLTSDYMYHLGCSLDNPRLPSLEHVSLHLAEIPMKANGFRTAGEVNKALLSENSHR